MNRLPPHVTAEIEQFAHSDTVQLVLDGLIDRHQEQWRTSAPENAASREDAYRMVRAIEGLKSELRRLSRDEAVEAYNLALRRKQNWSMM